MDGPVSSGRISAALSCGLIEARIPHVPKYLLFYDFRSVKLRPH